MTCPRCGESTPDERGSCARCGGSLVDSGAATRIEGENRTGTRKPEATVVGTGPGPAVTDVTFSVYGLSSGSQPTQGTPPLSGVFAGRYEVLALVGEGGMGRVYKVRDRELDKVIALKTIRGEGDPDSVLRFKQELVLARKVTHKNVVRIYDLGEAEGQKFFTMEFIEGESLKALVRRRSRLPPEESIGVARQVLSALQEAHDQGVVHRDLKPQNIMIDAAGIPHLMDFGIARSLENTGMTATGTIIGTPDYMSPEQVKGQKAGPASDIFSFGVIFYEMLTGDLPYKAETPASRIVMRLSTRPPAPRRLRKEIPKYLEGIVLKCLEVESEHRYPTVAALLADLDRHHVDRGLTVKLGRAVVRRRWPLVLSGAAALGLVAAGAWWARREVAPVKPEAVHTVAILPFTNASGSTDLEWLRSGLPEMLVTDLAQSRYVRAVPGERMARLLQEAGLDQQSRFDEAALEAVSKLAHAQSVLSGQFVESGGRLRLDLNLRRAGSGVPIPVKVEGASGDVFALVDQITGRIKESLDLSAAQLRTDRDRPLAETGTSSMVALRAYQAGLAELRRGAHQEAVPLLKEATVADPSFALAQARLAQAAAAADQRDVAASAADRALALAEQGDRPLAERYAIHAAVAQVREDHETAAKSYTELAKLRPEDPDVQFLLGEANEAMGHLPDALAAYEEAVSLEPTYGAALVALGRTQVMSGRSEDALRILDRALQSKPMQDNLELQGLVHVIMGTACRELARYDEALDHFGKSLDLRRKTGFKPGQASALSNMGDVYRRQGRPDKALDAQEQALALARETKDREGESAYLVSIGQIHERMGNLDKALGSFRESMQIEMERGDAVELASRQDHIAEIYRQKGQYEDALVYLEQARTHLEKSDEKREKAFNFGCIGLVRKAQGLYPQAVEAFLLALPLYKEVGAEESAATVQWDLATVYASQGRYADAYNNLRQSLAVFEAHESHDVADVRTEIAHVLIAVGRPDEAARELDLAEKAAGDGHGHGGHHAGPGPQLLFARGEIARGAGQAEAAQKNFEEANVQANLSGQKEVAVRSRVELGRLYLDQGKSDNALRLLARTREEAAGVRLRPLEAEALVALAEAKLAKGDAEGAKTAASDAVALAEKFAGRPVIYRAQAVLGEALDRLKRPEEALDAYVKAAAALEWVRGSVLAEHAASFVARPDLLAFARRTAAALEKGGRATEAASLGPWLQAGTVAAAAAGPASSPPASPASR